MGTFLGHTLHMGSPPPAPVSPGDAPGRGCPRWAGGTWATRGKLQVEVLSRCPPASRGLHLHRLPGGEEDGGRAARQGERWGGGRGGDRDPPLRAQTSGVAWGHAVRRHLCGTRVGWPQAPAGGDLSPPSVPPAQIPAAMTAEELTFEILDRRKIVVKEKDYWSCFEVNEREEAGWCGA